MEVQAARVCPGCGTEWNFSGCDVDPEEAVVMEQTQVPSSNPSSGKRLRSCKREAAQARNEEPVDPVPRKRLRSCKAEAVEPTQVQSQEPSVPVLRKKHQPEAVLNAEAGPSQPSFPSADVRRTLRSRRT